MSAIAPSERVSFLYTNRTRPDQNWSDQIGMKTEQREHADLHHLVRAAAPPNVGRPIDHPARPQGAAGLSPIGTTTLAVAAMMARWRKKWRNERMRPKRVWPDGLDS